MSALSGAGAVAAYSTEIGVPMDGRHIEAAEAIIAVAAQRRNLGDVYQSSPISFRFVKASDAYMSMMNGSQWGQVNTLSAAAGRLETIYPRYGEWLDVYRRLNSSGVFDSPFTERVGISAARFTP